MAGLATKFDPLNPPLGGETDPRELSTDSLRFVKIKGTAETAEHLPTASAFSLLQVIQEPL